MNDLVFLDPNRLDAVPFTTSKVIAEMTARKPTAPGELTRKEPK